MTSTSPNTSLSPAGWVVVLPLLLIIFLVATNSLLFVHIRQLDWVIIISRVWILGLLHVLRKFEQRGFVHLESVIGMSYERPWVMLLGMWYPSLMTSMINGICFILCWWIHLMHLIMIMIMIMIMIKLLGQTELIWYCPGSTIISYLSKICKLLS